MSWIRRATVRKPLGNKFIAKATNVLIYMLLFIYLISVDDRSPPDHMPFFLGTGTAQSQSQLTTFTTQSHINL